MPATSERPEESPRSEARSWRSWEKLDFYMAGYGREDYYDSYVGGRGGRMDPRYPRPLWEDDQELEPNYYPEEVEAVSQENLFIFVILYGIFSFFSVFVFCLFGHCCS